MLKNIKQEHINILHLIVIAPLLLYAGWKGHALQLDEKDKWIFRGLLIAGILVALWHGWCLWNKYGMKPSKKMSKPEEEDTDDED